MSARPRRTRRSRAEPTAADVGVRHTLDFVRAHAGRGRRRVLEVGCGDGRLAAALAASGYSVRGLDRNAQAVTRARRRGADVVHADFLSWREEGFDIVLFSRSLHHLGPLGHVVRHAAFLLAPGGRLLVEDFAADGLDEATAVWRDASEEILRGAGLLRAPGPRTLDGRALARWRAEHHGVTGEAALRRALSRHFTLREEPAPYLYRYVGQALGRGRRGRLAAEALLRCEEALIRAGAIRAVGRRWIGRPIGTGALGRRPHARPAGP